MARKYTLVLFVLLSCAMWSKAQVPLDQKAYADSLSNSLKLNTSDSIKARTYFLLSYYYITINEVKKSKLCLDKGSALGKRYPYLRAVYYFYESIVYLELDMERSRIAALTCDKLLSGYSDKEAYLFRARALHNTAIIEQRKDNIKGMVDITLNKTIPLTEAAINLNLQIFIHSWPWFLRISENAIKRKPIIIWLFKWQKINPLIHRFYLMHMFLRL